MVPKVLPGVGPEHRVRRSKLLSIVEYGPIPIPHNRIGKALDSGHYVFIRAELFTLSLHKHEPGNSISFSFFFFFLVPHFSVQGLFLALHSGIFPGSAWRPSEISQQDKCTISYIISLA